MTKGAPLLTAILLAMLTLWSAASCSGGRHGRAVRSSHADSVVFAAGSAMQYERMRALADSFELTGDMSPLDANRWRGVSYYRQGQNGMAEICFRKALEHKVKTDEDQLSYNKVARRLSELLVVKGDYEGALRIAIPAVQKMDESGIGSDIDYAILLNNIGCCQLNLGQDKEANESFLKAREHYANRWQSDPTGRGIQEALVGTVYTSVAYTNMRRYAESIYWIDRTEMLLEKYRQQPSASMKYIDEYKGRIEIMRAVALQELGKKSEAAKAYQAFLETAYAKTAAGHINANDYLVTAERYQEAADNYRYLDATLDAKGMEMTLDNIQLYLLPKYRANSMAQRADSARESARLILRHLDEAITAQKNSTTAELATIYDTHGKDTEIANQQVELSRQRLWAAAVAIVLLVTFFSIYTLIKRKSAHRLAAAHSELQKAYGQLEEATAQRERIESELRIARDIQMSMVPTVAPDYDGVDLYAAIQPAKAVGGDLYGYLLQGDRLYFCVGDVSGKGVPASLFMAQATRLFRTLAAQSMMPAEIATRMNNALTEGNEQGMFVTMFLGLIDLRTGRLDFCNAGHNPPAVEGDDRHMRFIDMLSNAPIGLWGDLNYDGEHIDNISGKLIFIYTDGLNEAENNAQEQLGDDRLLQVLNTLGEATAQEAVERLKATAERFRDGAEPNDDMTILALRIKVKSEKR